MKPIDEARYWCLGWLFSVTLLLSGGCGVKGPPVAPEDLLSDTNATSIEDDEQEDDSY